MSDATMPGARAAGQVRGRVWRGGRPAAENLTHDQQEGPRAHPRALVWLVLRGAAVAMLDKLAGELGLAPTAVEDAIAPGERPKATWHPSHTFVTVYDTTLAPGEAEQTSPTASRLRLARVSAFVVPRGLITVRPDDSFDMAEVVRRWDDAPELLAAGAPALLHALLDKVVDDHFSTIQAMDDAMEELEDSLFAADQPRAVQQRVYRLRKELVQLRRVVTPMREVVSAILRHRRDGSHEGHPAGLDAWYEDLYDHALRAAEWTESLRDMVATIFETNLSLQDSRLNLVMRKLAAWGAIIAVPTLVTGWFGQNIPFPGFEKPWGVALSGGLIVAAVVGLYLAFRRYQWL